MCQSKGDNLEFDKITFVHIKLQIMISNVIFPEIDHNALKLEAASIVFH